MNSLFRLFRFIPSGILLSIFSILFLAKCSPVDESTHSSEHSVEVDSLSPPSRTEIPDLAFLLSDTLDQWQDIFHSAGIEGTFALAVEDSVNHSKVHFLAYNNERAGKQYIPASTFKIFNSLVILEEKAVAGVHDTLKWDGKPRHFDSWNRDYDMADAIRHSCVWFYQEGARRVGKERMQFWLKEAQYGNQEMGAAIDSFWLKGTLAISAREQLKFLWKLNHGYLPFSAAVQEKVKEIMQLDQSGPFTLYGKTGWAINSDPMIGWFVGWVQKDQQAAYFAINIDMSEDSQAKLRKQTAYDILHLEGWWE